MASRKNFNNIEYFGGLAPVQAEGYVGGNRFYFRARGDRWAFVVAEHDAVNAFVGAEPVLWQRSEPFGPPGGLDASDMSHEIAHQIITQCGMDYLAYCNKIGRQREE